MNFAEELANVLPADLPHRANVITKTAQHLELIAQVNEHLNLTRITTPREAAIKHVLDSVLPWRLFAAAMHILDAGTGAGFPGIPLALVFPEIQFTLSESIQKKAKFVQSAVDALSLPNVKVTSERAEEFAAKNRVDVITARAVAPLSKAITLFAPVLKTGTRALFYKGPDAEAEIAEAKNRNLALRVVERYDLPDGLGTRTIVEIARRKT